MKSLTLKAGLVLGLVCFAVASAVAQQPQLSTDTLKNEIEKLAQIENDPGVPAEVRALNHTFLEERKSQLRLQLEYKITSLRNYKATMGSYLRPDEKQRVELLLTNFETELRNLGSSMPSEALSSESGPRGETRQPASGTNSGTSRSSTNSTLRPAECPSNADDLIKELYAVASPNAATLLTIRLNVPLSTTQSAPVTLEPPNVPPDLQQVVIPPQQIVITIQHGGTSTNLDSGQYKRVFTTPGRGRLEIQTELVGPLPANATNVTVRLINLNFECPSGSNPTAIAATSKSGKVYDAKSFNEKTTKAYDAAVAAAKSPDRKAFSAGFAAAKSESKKAEGASDLLINKTFSKKDLEGTILDVFDQASLSFAVKKSSAEGVDPRHLSIGLTFRKTFLINVPSRPQILVVDDRPISEIEKEALTISETMRRVRNKGFFRVVAVGGGLKLEGEAFDFKTVNFVTDPSIEIGSIAKRLGSKGYYNVSFIGATELGRNLSKPDASAKTPASALSTVNWIARFMAGGQMTLRYLPTDESGDHWGLEANLIYANRHLFRNELFTDVTGASKVLTIGKGNKSWKEADFKVFLFGDEKARYGFKVSYMNGALPPAFSHTKGFQYGFVVETTDDKSNGQAANKN